MSLDLERAAFAVAVVCIVLSIMSVVAGAYGTLAHDEQASIAASSSALASAISLTVCIALFHGKCHLLHRRPLLRDVTIADRDVIEAARTQHFGWSFALAWICVALCFVHTWVWLVKAQYIHEKFSAPASTSLRSTRAQRRRVRDAEATGAQSHVNNAVSLDE